MQSYILTILIIAVLYIIVWVISIKNRAKNYQQASYHYQRIIYLLLDEFGAGEKELYKQVLRWYVYTHQKSNKPNKDGWGWNEWLKTLHPNERFLGKVIYTKTAFPMQITQGILEEQRSLGYLKKQVPKKLTVEQLTELL